MKKKKVVEYRIYRTEVGPAWMFYIDGYFAGYVCGEDLAEAMFPRDRYEWVRLD